MSLREVQTWSIRALLDWTTDRFARIGIPDARLDAQILLAEALGCSRMDLYVNHDRPVDADERARFRALVQRRLAREPVAYVVGRRGFHALDLELTVDRRVLVPRPETELLVDWVLEELPPANPDAPGAAPGPRVVDVGTGSGAIALAVARARPDAAVVACDLSPGALEVARLNAAAAHLAVTVVEADLLGGVSIPAGGFDAVVANLPYIPSADLEQLAPEVAAFEPRAALDGGPDGLDPIRRLVGQVAAPGVAAGGLYLEVGVGQAEPVAQLLRDAGWAEVAIRPDLAGIPRMVRGRGR